MKNIREKIKEDLFNLGNKKYKEFHSNLCPGDNKTKNMIGIRIPILREYAKKLIKEYKIEQLLKQIDNEYYEEIMLQGILIGLSKDEFEKTKKYIEKFIPKIDNWAVCDTFCAGLKITKKHKKEMWNLIQKYLKSDKEYELRFGIVMILNYFIDEKYLQKNFEIFDSINIKNNDYYVQMAIAWAISESLAKFYNDTIKYLKECILDKFTYNKAIQKAIESYRITNEQKRYLREIKK